MAKRPMPGIPKTLKLHGTSRLFFGMGPISLKKRCPTLGSIMPKSSLSGHACDCNNTHIGGRVLELVLDHGEEWKNKHNEE